jgi:hypothetical protein
MLLSLNYVFHCATVGRGLSRLSGAVAPMTSVDPRLLEPLQGLCLALPMRFDYRNVNCLPFGDAAAGSPFVGC